MQSNPWTDILYQILQYHCHHKITNITEKEFKAEDFKTLYFYRWGIETVYDTLKNKLLAERFSGKSTVAVLQEYYAMMFILNCIAAMSATVERKLASTKAGCKYRYHTNVNLMIGYLKYRLSSMLLFKRSAEYVFLPFFMLILKSFD